MGDAVGASLGGSKTMDRTKISMTNSDRDTYQTEDRQTEAKSNRKRSNMTIDIARLRISRDLSEAEAALDEALLRQSHLLSTMVGARRASGVAPFVGQDALHRLVRSQQAMLNAGGELARVHGRLSTIAIEVGATEMVAGNDPCPTPAFGMADNADFSEVATENQVAPDGLPDGLIVHPRAA